MLNYELENLTVGWSFKLKRPIGGKIALGPKKILPIRTEEELKFARILEKNFKGKVSVRKMAGIVKESQVEIKAAITPKQLPKEKACEVNEDRSALPKQISQILNSKSNLKKASLAKKKLSVVEPIEEPTIEEEPVVEEETIIEEPVPADELIVEEPTIAEEPAVVDETIVEESTIVDEPVAEDEPMVEEPTIEDEPIVEEPVVEEEPIVEEPAIEEELQVEKSNKKQRGRPKKEERYSKKEKKRKSRKLSSTSPQSED